MIFSPCIFIIFRVAWVSSITMKEIRSHDQESGTCNFVCNAPVKQDIQTCNPRKQNLLVNAGINKIQKTYYSNGEERTINYHIKTIELFPFLFNQEAAKFINVKRTLPWHGAKSNIRPVVLVLQRSTSVRLNSMAFGSFNSLIATRKASSKHERWYLPCRSLSSPMSFRMRPFLTHQS